MVRNRLGDSARDEAWVELRDREYDTAWRRFDENFGFRPGTSPAFWPGITEPSPSMTLDLSAIVDGPRRASAAEAINAEVLRVLVWSEPEMTELVVLDWQHPAYLFQPATQALTQSPEWKVTPYPDGDYSAFLSPDYRHGIFGHPWEQTLCIMGEPLVRAFGQTLGAWLPVKRRNGSRA